ncbi:VOC family protein [Nonomuraea sp. NN258]|uniref:VOC family protein n=1 Tax=Nonomuraea antri TaxID=2730852 RepID=UPI001569A906|nr:VOC family protein [Nonomuraea antri]NRQ33687.1 VOC family protein [Nonomuraea antri]
MNATPTLDHAGLTCADLNASLVFYRDLLGMPLLESGEAQGRAAGIEDAWLTYAMLDAGRGQMIELLQYRDSSGSSSSSGSRGASVAPPVSSPGGGHVALGVPDLDLVLGRLAEAGFHPLTATPVTMSGPGLGRWDGARLVYVLDPDRHVIELVQFAV